MTSGSAIVTAVDDNLVEGSEEIAITASQGTTPIGSVEIGITDNDVPQFASVSAATLAEGESTTLTVETGGVTFARAQTISLTLSGSATLGEDYTIAPASITLAAGATSGSATVTAVDDAEVEEAETITIAATHGTTPIVGSVEIGITDNDVPRFALSVSAATVAEGESTTVTVDTGGVTFASAQTISLTLSGSATLGEDYTITSESITLAAHQTAGSATITTIDDSQVEKDETITIAARQGRTLIETKNIIIEDNDAANFSLTVDTDTITEEGAGSATVTVSTGGVTFDSAQTISLDLGGSATAAADYTIAPANITIAANATSGSAIVTAVDDNLVEGSEEIAITASQGTTPIGSVEIGITDNDVPQFALSVSADTLAEGESTTLTVDTGGVTFDSAQTITLALDGDATAEEDYTIAPASITLAAGATSGSATVTAVDDAEVEEAETITIAATHGTTPIVGSVEIRITDNDVPRFELSVSATTVAEGESTTLTVDTGGVTFATEQTIALALSSSATAAEDDYTITPESITIAANQTSGSATITVVDDTLLEDAETITLEASHDGALIGSVDITISASDQTDFNLLVPEPPFILEGESTTLTVDTGGVTFDSDQTITLEFSGNATAAEDYTIAESITIKANQTSASATITTIDDSEVEVDETITLEASHDGDEIGTRNVTIVDNDTANFTLTVTPAAIDEGDDAIVTVDTGGVTFDSDQTITLEFSGNATAADYTITPESITLAANQTAGSATIMTIDDSEVEEDETITLEASHDGAEIGTWNVTIVDNDTADFTLTVSPAAIDEGDDAIVTVDTGGVAFATDQTITLALGGSALARADYTITPANITIAAHATSGSATVTARDDTVVEDAESITIAATHGTTEIGSLAIRIADNDEPQFALTVSTDTVAEGESTTVTVDTGGVTFATAQRITLELGGSATAGEDYTITPASITLAANATSGSATITALDDTEQEAAETITLAASHDAAPIGTLDISISASDQTAFSLLLFPEDAAITEGESATVTVDTGGVTFATAQTITLELSGSATAEEDYTITPASITIAADATSGSATITTADDAEAEGVETITIAASHEAVSIGTRNLTINDNDAAFSLTVHPATIAEGEAAIVTVDTGGVTFATAQTIALELSGSATAEEDYTITPASITIAADATSGSATITALDDSDAEGAETITLAASHDATPIGTAEVTILASDETDERTAFSLAVSSRSIAEGEQATVTVDTGGDTFATDQSVTLVLAGSATAGVGNDYTIVPRNITIPANQTLGSATVTALNDSLTEGAETIAIAASHDGTEIGTATITIRDQVDDTKPDDDTRPEVTAITSTAQFPANAAFAVTITFSERVTGLAVAAIEVTNGAAAKLAGSGTTYTVEVTPRADFQGSATVTVPADAATDAAGNGNLAGSAEFAVDTRAPTVRDATLDQPLGAWTGSTDTGAPTSSGLVRYSDDSGGAGAGGSEPAAARAANHGRDAVTLTYDEALDQDSRPPVSAFAVRVGGLPRQVSTVAVSGSRVRLTLAAPVTPGQRVTLSYTAPTGATATPIRDRAGNAAPDVAVAPVTGRAAQTAPAARYERVNRALLPYVAATLHAGTLAAVGDRFDAADSGPAPAGRLLLGGADRLAGTGLDLAAGGGGREPGREELLDGMAFVLPLAAARGAPETAAGAVALWGSGDYRRLSSGAGAGSADLEWGGDLLSIHVGADLQVSGAVLAGVAVSWSQGTFDYTDRDEPGAALAGEYKTDLLSVHPYASWSLPGTGLGLWMAAGYGWGEVKIDDELSSAQTSGARLLTGAVGGRARLLATEGLIAGGLTELRLKAEGALARIEVTGSGALEALELDARRLRLLLVGSHAQQLPWGGRLTPVLEVGLRHDAGAGPQGEGLELGGELSYADPGLGLTLQGHGRLLATHRSAYEEWGAGGVLRLEVGVGGRGLSLSVAPSWGAAASGTQGLWERLEAEVGYGLPAVGQGVLTPYGGFTLAGAGARDYRVGARLELERLAVSLEGTRRESARGAAEHDVTLRGGLRY